jgi:RHS repeat-associated protein
MRDSIRRSIGFVAAMLVLAFSAAHAQEDPARFADVRGWKGTLTWSAAEQGEERSCCTTFSWKILQKAKVTDLALRFTFPGNWDGFGTIQPDPTPPIVADETKLVITATGEVRTSETAMDAAPYRIPFSLVIDFATGTYTISMFPGVRVHVVSRAESSETTDFFTNLDWIPVELNEPLPASGLRLAGSRQFTPSDCLFCYPFAANRLTQPLVFTWDLQAADIKDETVDDPCLSDGSILGCQNQSVGQVVSIVGTPFSLHYQSDRVGDRDDAWRVALSHADFHLQGWTLDVHHAYDPDRPAIILGDGRRRSGINLRPAIERGGELLVASADSSEVYVFSATGERDHLRTLDALTGAVRYRFSYSAPLGLLTSITDGNGNVTTIERNADEYPTAIVGPFGQRTSLTLTSGFPSYLATIVNPALDTVRLSYTAGGLLTAMTDPRGNVRRYTYDTTGRLTRAENGAGGFKTLTRTETTAGHIVDLRTAVGQTTRFAVDNPERPNDRRVNRFPTGLQASVTRNDSTRVSAFPDGTRTTETLGPDPRWGVQAPVQLSLSIQMPSGLRSATTMARAVTLAAAADPLSLVSQTDTMTLNGRVYRQTYTAATRTLIDTSPEGRRTTVTLDAKGRVIRVQLTGLQPTTYAYDPARGLLRTVTEGAGAGARVTTYGYDTRGRLSTIRDALGRVVSFIYDDAGRVIRQTLPDGRANRYAYDRNGNLTTVTPPGSPARVHALTYTPIDLLSAYRPPQIGPTATPTLYTYDADGQVTNIARPDGNSVRLSYDSAGRVRTMTLRDGEIRYTYNAATGTLARLTSPDNSTVSYTYDGLLRKGDAWIGSVVGSVGRTYDADFRVSSYRVNGAVPIQLRYDRDSLLVNAGLLAITRDAATGLVRSTVLDDVTDRFTYNGFGEITRYVVDGLYDAAYQRDAVGRLTALTERLGPGTDTYTYTYDLAGRLTRATRNGATAATYTYDGNGNRLTRGTPTVTVTTTYDSQDRLLRSGTATFTYTLNGDLQGRIAGGQRTTYEYDGLGNLQRVTLPGGRQIGYIVDGSNRRTGKTVNGVRVQGFLYQDDLRPIAELDGSNAVVSRFVYGLRDNVPDYMIKAGATYRIVTDHRGSPRLVVHAASRVIAQRIDYDEFGRVTRDTNPGFQPFGFAGGLYDPDTKLVRFGARDYDADTGRWTIKDPIGFRGGDTNLYSYVGNDPVNAIDPSGLSNGKKAPTLQDRALRESIRQQQLNQKNMRDLARDAAEAAKASSQRRLEAAEKKRESEIMNKKAEQVACESASPISEGAKEVAQAIIDALIGK